jgi:catechol 1,2-dioxygenase
MLSNATVAPGTDHSLETFKATLTDDFTNNVINSMSAETPERARVVMTSLIRHLHSFVREVQLKSDEFMLGVDTLNRAGQMSDDKRNEGLLVSDVFGLEALVDQITQESLSSLNSESLTPATLSAILGPFFREGAPKYENGGNISVKHISGDPTTWMEGHIYDTTTGKPIEGAEVDLWHTASNGLYEQQDPEQPDYNNRGKFFTDKNGYYSAKCLCPTSYPIPFDGPAGDLLKLMGRQ